MEYFLDNLQSYEGDTIKTEDGNHMVAIHIFDSIGIEHNYVLDIGTYSIHRSNVTPIMDEYDIKGLLFDGQNKHKEPELVKVWLEEDSIEQILVDNNCLKYFSKVCC